MSRIVARMHSRVPAPEQYALASGVFLRLLGAIYAIAFASLGIQIVGLVGEGGILPVSGYLAMARQGWGVAAWWRLPSVFWLSASDLALGAAAVVGVAFGLCLVAGVMARLALVGAFALYLSLVYAGQIFTNYQWDQLLLETGFLAIFLTGGSRVVVFLYRCLLFRFLFLAGVTKLASGDPTWRHLTALAYHFWTQPLPSPLAWYAAGLPEWLLAGATAATLVIELGFAFLIFLPRRPRVVAAAGVLLFQVMILLTGNFGFFNLLTMLLCVFLFDDVALRRFIPMALEARLRRRGPGRAATATAAALALILVPAGADRVWRALAGSDLPLAGALVDALAPWQIVNSYGPFITTTTTRPEIIIEGSDDARTWLEYGFRFKPGAQRPCPSWNIPHQPRLDWQMWFAAYGSASENLWFASLMRRLLEGSPAVLALLGDDPFPDHPPKFVRALLYDYRFADPELHQAGQCWVRRQAGLYFPQVTLDDLARGATR